MHVPTVEICPNLPTSPSANFWRNFKKVPPLARKVDGDDCACEPNQVDGAFRDATSGSEIWKQYGEAQAQVCRRELRPERNKETREGEVLHSFHILQEPAPGRRVQTKLLGIKVMMHRLMTKLERSVAWLCVCVSMCVHVSVCTW